MRNDFLNDDWLKEELADEDINDDDFSFSVIKKIELNKKKDKTMTYVMLAAMITLFSFLFIPDLMMIAAENAISFSVSEQQIVPFLQMEFIGLLLICLIFIMIWSFEDFDLI